VRVNGKAISFRLGETIHTENSYKYTIEGFRAIADGAGWSPLNVWSDGRFSLHAFRKTDGERTR
jgi:L-histidine Nalpha-methyltransferase